MSRRFQVILTAEQHAYLTEESRRSSVSVGELIRRAIDTTYEPFGDRIVHVITHSVGRRSGLSFDRWGD
jgi:hypothetical protein